MAAVRHHRAMAARENPIHSRLGYLVITALIVAATFWFLAPAFARLFGGRDESTLFGNIAVPIVLAIMMDRTRQTSYPELDGFRRNPMAHAWLQVDWSEAGIDADPGGPNPLAWRKLEKWSESDGMMFIYFRPRVYAFLPRRALSGEERVLMRGYLEAARIPEAGKPWWRW